VNTDLKCGSSKVQIGGKIGRAQSLKECINGICSSSDKIPK
jgi:hypothetical protein